MLLKSIQSLIVVASVAVAGFAGCADEPAAQNPNGKATGQGPCDTSAECAGDVCVAVIDTGHPPVYCSQSCATAGCPSGFFCDSQTFALIGLRYCRFGETQPSAPPAEPPRLPCKIDADCDNGQVCAESGGVRDCTLPCANEEQCTPPATGGFVFDFLTCKKDDKARSVCLPDAACYSNPLNCTKSPF